MIFSGAHDFSHDCGARDFPGWRRFDVAAFSSTRCARAANLRRFVGRHLDFYQPFDVA